MTGAPAQFASPEGHKDSLANVRRKLIVRILGASVVIALIALAASQQATSTPNTASHKSSKQVQLNVVHDSTKANSSSEGSASSPDVTNTTDSSGGSASNTSNSSIDVTVNGQPIDVPENGSSHQTVTTDGSSTSVDISHSSDDSGTSFSSNFHTTHLNNSSANTSVNTNFRSNQSFSSDKESP
jgi:cytoskeletal protein RodZ